ncbi:MAG: PKD domain-containing protein [Euryarchaeota archaeon]|nr:PKD domain-containing protein [Euryarchaeota archaeon]
MRRALVAAVMVLLLPLPVLPQPATGGAPQTGTRDTYRDYAGLVSELSTLQSVHPDLVMMENIGRTYEGRDIWAVKLSDDVRANDTSEPDILVLGPVHARERMGVEVTMSVLNYLLLNYGINETCSLYVNTRETWFVPMPNPDGHAYVTAGNDWRKNRRPTVGGNTGVDLNRNWGHMFGVDGATSDNPASEVYHGPYPFSENETVAVRDLALRQRFSTSIAFHSHGQLILYPWGYTSAPAPDRDELDAMARTMAAWNGYTPQQSNALYATHGSSDDWFYGNTSCLAFTFELDTQFYPPDSQIPVTCALNREPVLYLVGYPNASLVDAGVLRLEAPFNNTLVEPDRELNISARIMNYGTAEADIPVEAGIASGAYNWSDSSTVRLRPGQSGLCNISWFPPLLAGENCTVTVRTNLSGDGSAWNDERAARFRVKAKYGAALEAQEGTERSCYPGESVSFPLLLRSLSNRENELLLELTGAKTAWGEIAPSVHLPPAGSADIELRVSVPRDAAPGASAAIAVRAFSSTGQGAAGLVATRTNVLDPAPTAVAGEDITVNVTKEALFDGSRSTTPTGVLVNWSWDLGDGSTAGGATVRHAYMRRGTYLVNLTVRNDLGYNRTDSLNVTVRQEFSLSLRAETLTVRPAPGETVVVKFTLENAGNGPDRVALSLDAPEWNASIDAGNATLAAGEALRFSLTIRVPGRALAGSAASFRVTARSTESAYAGDERLFRATVREDRDLSFNLSEPSRRLDAGQTARFSGRFSNGGNIAENLSLEAGGVPEGWTVEFSRPNVTVAPWSNESVTITVRVPAAALAGDYSLSVNGVELAISVNARFGADATVDNATAVAYRGETVTFNVTVFNDANAPDTLTVSVGDLPAGWPEAMVVQPGELLARRNITLTVVVAVPANATAGTVNLRLSVRSAGDPNLSREIPLRVTVLKRPAAAGPADGPPLFLLVLVVVVIAAVAAAAVFAMRRKGRSPGAAGGAQQPDGPQEGMPP